MREKLRLIHMSIFTDTNYIRWVKKLLTYHRAIRLRNSTEKEVTSLPTRTLRYSEEYSLSFQDNPAKESAVLKYLPP